MSVIIGIMGASLFVLILLTGTLMSSTGFYEIRKGGRDSWRY